MDLGHVGEGDGPDKPEEPAPQEGLNAVGGPKRAQKKQLECWTCKGVGHPARNLPGARRVRGRSWLGCGRGLHPAVRRIHGARRVPVHVPAVVVGAT